MRRVSTREMSLRSHPEMVECWDWRAIAGMQRGLLVELSPGRVRARSPFDQQSTTERARPASLVSLYLLFMSLAVWARASTVASKSTRCLDAISLLAIAKAVHALTAPKAHRSMHGTCT